MTEWIILDGKCAIRHGSFMLLETEKVIMPLSSHSQNRWDVKWVLSEWGTISCNAHSGRLGFYLNSENKKYIFSPRRNSNANFYYHIWLFFKEEWVHNFCSFVKCLPLSFGCWESGGNSCRHYSFWSEGTNQLPEMLAVSFSIWHIFLANQICVISRLSF